MKPGRRDAIAALAAAGVAVGAGGATLLTLDDRRDADRDGPIPDRQLAVLGAAAEALYPSAIEDEAAFATHYLEGRAADAPAFADGVTAAATYLDEYSRAWFDRGFTDLDPPRRRDALHRMNADTADPDPGGSDVERVRYFVVNELLFALYASPTGGRLVGVENPPGYPGGLASYRRGEP